MKRSGVSDDDFLRVEASDCPMSSCAAPAGSPCRTGKGRVAAQYHTARFRLVPHLAKALSVPAPPLRRPGSAWAELPRPAAAGAGQAQPLRIGYARASTVRQSLDTQTDSLKAAGVTRIFAEKISTRAVTRPELDKAVALAREMRASGVAVTLVVHEHKRLGRGIELAALAEQRIDAPRRCRDTELLRAMIVSCPERYGDAYQRRTSGKYLMTFSPETLQRIKELVDATPEPTEAKLAELYRIIWGFPPQSRAD